MTDPRSFIDRIRPIGWISILLIASSACSRTGVPDRPLATAEDRSWPGGGLPKSGWIAAPLVLGKDRLPEISVEVDSVKLLMIVDSGAAWLILDSTAADRLKLTMKPADGNVGGLGTAKMASHVTQFKSFKVGSYEAGPIDARVIDLSAVNQSRTFNGDRPIDGLIGATFLIDHGGVISYPSKTLYLRPRTAAPLPGP